MHLTSALTGEGIEALLQKIAARLVSLDLRPGDAVPFCQSQVDNLHRAKEALSRNDIPKPHCCTAAAITAG